MDIEKATRRAIEKKDERRYRITAERKEDYIDERTKYRNEYDAALERQTVVDVLTGLRNRTGFTDELDKVLKSMRQPAAKQRTEKERSNEQPVLEKFSLLFIDLDNFKRVNDTLGHAAGDSALKKVAEILKKSVRMGDVVARLHGDEFAAFLPRANEEKARTIGGKIVASLQNDDELQKFDIGASIGARCIDKSSLTELMTPESLIEDADFQQMKAKQNGKGRVEIQE